LEQARSNRQWTERARRLARNIGDETALANLVQYADELEEATRDLEERACALAETIATS
jgi:hypothetical protein